MKVFFGRTRPLGFSFQAFFRCIGFLLRFSVVLNNSFVYFVHGDTHWPAVSTAARHAYDGSNEIRGADAMFRQLNRFCAPHKRLLSRVLIVVGALLLLLFIPVEVWMILAGIAILAIGILYTKS
jgi:hypothetical protein